MALSASGTGAPAELPEEACTPHRPIVIEERSGSQGFERSGPVPGDREVRDGSGVVGGNGTADDPYVIEDWCIVAPVELTRDRAAIEIRTTDAHVLVQDNVLLGRNTPAPGGAAAGSCAAHGVWVRDAGNVSVVDNRLRGHDDGLHLDRARNASVAGNHLGGNCGGVAVDLGASIRVDSNELRSTGGITADRVDELAVLDNRLQDGGPGIDIDGVPDVRVRGNTVTGPSGEGISVAFSEDGEVVANTVEGARDGIEVVESPGTLVANTTIRDSDRHGIHARSERVNATGNTVQGADTVGIRLVRAHGSSVADNDVTGTGLAGIQLASTNASAVQSNEVHGNDRDGILLGSASGNEIADNRVHDDERRGIVVDSGSDDNRIHHNLVEGSGSLGLLIEDSDAASVDHNRFRANGGGVWVEASTGAEVERNEFLETSGMGAEAVPSPVDATHNWWGCPEGPGNPGCDDVDGPVEVEPVLESPVTDAGPR